jgi:hypothetical protein
VTRILGLPLFGQKVMLAFPFLPEVGLTKLHNTHNSKEIFDDFKFTGLNNFDFFATQFYIEGFGDEENIEE